jgi:hypothetical protein
MVAIRYEIPKLFIVLLYLLKQKNANLQFLLHLIVLHAKIVSFSYKNIKTRIILLLLAH